MQFDLTQAIQVLARTPKSLHVLLADQADGWIRGNEGAESFSPFDVIGHLIDGEETDWIPRARIILAQGPDPRFTPYDRFRHKTRNVGRSMNSLLEEFTRLRGDNIDLLRSWNLTRADLTLPGNHPSLGRVSLEQLFASWVVHDLGHIAQISRVMAKQYRESVGPWVAYLPVLTDREPLQS